MTTTSSSSMHVLAILAVVGFLFALPTFASAAVYAYVMQNGQVGTVSAATPEAAMIAAPNIDENSGVMLVDTVSDEDILGEYVSGM